MINAITSEKVVVFHDPNKDAVGSYRRQPLDHFRNVFESVDGPELARYYIPKN